MVCLIVVEEGLWHDCGVNALSRGCVLNEGISLCTRLRQVVTVRFLRGTSDSAELQRGETRSDGPMTLKREPTTKRKVALGRVPAKLQVRDGLQAAFLGNMIWGLLTAATARERGAGITDGGKVFSGN